MDKKIVTIFMLPTRQKNWQYFEQSTNRVAVMCHCDAKSLISLSSKKLFYLSDKRINRMLDWTALN